MGADREPTKNDITHPGSFVNFVTLVGDIGLIGQWREEGVENCDYFVTSFTKSPKLMLTEAKTKTKTELEYNNVTLIT